MFPLASVGNCRYTGDVFYTFMNNINWFGENEPKAAKNGFNPLFWLRGATPSEIKLGEIALIYQAFMGMVSETVTYISGAVSTGKIVFPFMQKHGLEDYTAFKNFIAANGSIYHDEVIKPNLVALESAGAALKGAPEFGMTIIPGEFDKWPTPFDLYPGAIPPRDWTRDNFFMPLWLLILERFAIQGLLTEGWATSRGSNEEFCHELQMICGWTSRSEMMIYGADAKLLGAEEALTNLQNSTRQLHMKGFPLMENLSAMVMLDIAISMKHSPLHSDGLHEFLAPLAGRSALKKAMSADIGSFLKDHDLNPVKNWMLAKSPSQLASKVLGKYFAS